MNMFSTWCSFMVLDLTNGDYSFIFIFHLFIHFQRTCRRRRHINIAHTNDFFVGLKGYVYSQFTGAKGLFIQNYDLYNAKRRRSQQCKL